jgi:hypothetical protein
MASSWSALKVELLETGANAGQWGNLTNANLGDAVLGEAITGQATVDFSSDADVTITLTDAATTQAARNLRLNITESSTGVGSVRNLILGSGCQIEKFYLINNTGTGAKTIKNTSGTGISVPAGKATLVYNNGTNVVDAASYFTSLTLGSALPITSGGTGSTSTTFANLTTNVTGILPVANGGTNLASGTSGGVLAYTATGVLASSGALAANNVVVGGGAGAAPSSTNLLAISAAVTTGNYIKAIGYADTVTALGNTGSAINLDVTSGNVFTATLNQSSTITLRYPVATGSSSFTLILTNGSGGPFTVAWAGGSFKFPGGAASLSRTTTAGAIDVWFFFTPDGGTTYFGSIPMKNLTA